LAGSCLAAGCRCVPVSVVVLVDDSLRAPGGRYSPGVLGYRVDAFRGSWWLLGVCSPAGLAPVWPG
jgi:hypothetical protein